MGVRGTYKVGRIALLGDGCVHDRNIMLIIGRLKRVETQ